MNRRKKAKAIRKAIRLTWDSLNSHLKWTYSKKFPRRESAKFHKECVKEYATTIKLLSKLY